MSDEQRRAERAGMVALVLLGGLLGAGFSVGVVAWVEHCA